MKANISISNDLKTKKSYQYELTRQRALESWTSCQDGFLHFLFRHLVSSHLLEVSQRPRAPLQRCRLQFCAPWECGHLGEEAVERSCHCQLLLVLLELGRGRGRLLQSPDFSFSSMSPKIWRRRRPSWRRSSKTSRWTSWRNLTCDFSTHASRRRSLSLTWTLRTRRSSPWATWNQICAWRATCPSSPPSRLASEGPESSSEGLAICSPPIMQLHLRYILQFLITDSANFFIFLHTYINLFIHLSCQKFLSNPSHGSYLFLTN